MRNRELTRCECVRQQWQTIPNFVKCVSCESDSALGLSQLRGVFQWTDGLCGTAALCVRPGGQICYLTPSAGDWA